MPLSLDRQGKKSGRLTVVDTLPTPAFAHAILLSMGPTCLSSAPTNAAPFVLPVLSR